MSILHMVMFHVPDATKRQALKALFDAHYPTILKPYDIEHYSLTAENATLEQPNLKFTGCLLMLRFKNIDDYQHYLDDTKCHPHRDFKALLQSKNLLRFPEDVQVFGMNTSTHSDLLLTA